MFKYIKAVEDKLIIEDYVGTEGAPYKEIGDFVKSAYKFMTLKRKPCPEAAENKKIIDQLTEKVNEIATDTKFSIEHTHTTLKRLITDELSKLAKQNDKQQETQKETAKQLDLSITVLKGQQVESQNFINQSKMKNQ